MENKLENKVIKIQKNVLRDILREVKKDRYGFYFPHCNSTDHCGVIKEKVFSEKECIRRHCRCYERVYLTD